MKFMLTCKDASKLVSQSLDQPLSLSNRIRLGFHLFICEACRQFNRQLGLLRNAVHRMKTLIENDSSIQLSPDAKARIARAVAANKH